MMQREDALLYLCCTQDLPPDRLEQILVIASAPTLDWEYIFALAHEHGVAPLIYHNLQKAHTCGATLPSTIIHRFKLATYQNALAKQKLGEHLSHALTFLRANQIDAMLFKGMALDSTVYDHPWYTVSKDVDLVLRPQFPGSWQHERQKLETKLHGLGIEFELNVHHDMTLNGALSVDFNQIWHDASLRDFEGNPLYLMSPEDLLLAICINSCRKRYFRLRSLCDIAETTKRFPDLEWSLFVQKAIAYGCNNIVYAALCVAQATVTAPVPRQVLDDLEVGTIRRVIIHQAIHYLVRHLTLRSLSYYTGPEWIDRKVGWSLVLPYLTYRWKQMGSKLHETVTACRVP